MSKRVCSFLRLRGEREEREREAAYMDSGYLLEQIMMKFLEL